MRTRLRLPEEQRIVVYTGWAGTLQATPPNRQLETMAQSRAWRKVEIEAVIDHDRAGVIATLERVRAQLEAEQADADGTVRKPWQLISEAIDHLRGINSRAQDDRSETEAPKQADDLTSIRGVSPALAEHLASLGVTRYAQITAWRADDVRNVAQALGLTREISRQNWIEQAAMLEHRKANGDNEVTADGAASMPEAGGGVAPAAPATIDLPTILQAIRGDEPAHEQASPPPAVEQLPSQLREPADADRRSRAACRPFGATCRCRAGRRSGTCRTRRSSGKTCQLTRRADTHSHGFAPCQHRRLGAAEAARRGTTAARAQP